MSDILPKTDLIDHAAFDRLLISSFPEVAAELDDDDRSLLHMEMAALARATCRAIEHGDQHTLTRHFEFIDGVFSNAAPDVENAVYVSYLENVFLGEQQPPFLRARSALPPRLVTALFELEKHFRVLGASEGVINYVRDKNAGSDVRKALTDAVEELRDVHMSSDTGLHTCLLVATQGVVFGAATGMNEVAFRLEATFKARALHMGAEDATQIGRDWVTFRLGEPTAASIDLKFWSRKAFDFARQV